MTSAEPMTERAAHYTALLETIEHQGSASLHGRERDQLMEAADGLLFGEQGSEQRLRERPGADRVARGERPVVGRVV